MTAKKTRPFPFPSELIRSALMALAFLGLALAAAPLKAQIVYDIPDGLVEIAEDGQCSLLEAFHNIGTQSEDHDDCPAGSSGDLHIVNLAPDGLYILDSEAPSLLEGLIDVAIAGSGATIRHAPPAEFGVMIESRLEGLFELAISDLTLDFNGEPDTLIRHGGGVLRLDNVTLQDASVGVEAFSFDAVNAVDVFIDDSTFQDLGIAVLFDGQDGDNEARPLEIRDTLISGNNLGVLVNPATLVMERVVYEPPYSEAVNLVGGQFGVETIAEIRDTLFDGITGIGLHIQSNSDALVERSAFVGGSGIGILLTANTSSTDIRNSTFSALNVGLEARASSQATINNATFAFNDVAVDREGNGSAQVFASNSIFADSGNVNCIQQRLDSNQHNLDDDGSCIDDAEESDILFEDPLLGALADNGGFTPTHALNAGSPAINAGHPGGDGPGSSCEATDQRGVARPQGGRCDIGAFEVLFSDIALSKTITSGEIYEQAGDVIEYELEAFNTGDTTLTNVVISDPDLGPLSCTPGQPATLPPGSDTLVCTGSYTVTAEDAMAGFFTNTATVNAVDPDENPVSDQDSATAFGPSVFIIPNGAVEFDLEDGLCSLVEAFFNIAEQDQLSTDEGECPRGSPVLNTVILASGGEYPLEAPDGESFSYLELTSVPVVIEGNNAVIFRPSLGDDLPVFESFSDFSLESLTLDGGGLESPLIIHGGETLRLLDVTLRNSGEGIDAFEELPIAIQISASEFRDLGEGLIVSGSSGLPTNVQIFGTDFIDVDLGAFLENARADISLSTFEHTGNPFAGTGLILDGTQAHDHVVDNTSFLRLETGIDIRNGNLALARSTFALGGAGVLVDNPGFTVDIANSTFSGQELGLGTLNGDTLLNNVTFGFNETAVFAQINGGPTIFTSNTLFADDGSDNCVGGGVVSDGFNLDSDGTCVDGATDLTGLDPQLDDLADNGGQTLTHALLPGSPAINAGNPSTDPEFGPLCESNDQRGVARPQDENCDIGAFELEPTNPEITLDKSIVSGSPFDSAGDVIVYELVATNTGDVTLTNVTISDPDVDVTNCTPAQGSSLDPAESMSCDGSYTVTQDDVDGGGFVNTATAEGTAPDASVVSDVDTAIADGLRNPDIVLAKSITSGDPYAEAGDVITYLLVATNTGNITLGDVTISDPALGALDCTPAQPAELAPGETLSCTGSYTVTTADVIAGSFTNTATASGTGTDENVVFDMDSATATEAGNPEVTLDKSIVSGSPYSSPGDVISYSLVATNTGDVTLTNVTISDPDLGALSCTPAQPATLAPEEALTCTGSYTVTGADIEAGSFTNTATAGGVAPDESLVSAQDSATALAVLTPVITLAKTITAGSPYSAVGNVISYSMVATNAGNADLTGVTISDSALGALSCTPAQPATLAPEEALTCTGSYTVTQADLNAGSFTNTATATAADLQGTVVSAVDSATATALSNPQISLTKTISDGAPFEAAGDVISYSLVATNSGNLTLTGFAINDPLIGELSCTPAQPAIRQPGQSMSCTGSYTVSQADVDAGSVTNTATARGLDPLNALISALASAIADGPVAAPAIRMNKSITAGSPYSTAGDVIEYLLEMTNNGNVTLTDAIISDPGLDLLDCGSSTSTIMAAGSSAPVDARQTRQSRASRMSGPSRADSRQRLMRRSGAASRTAAESAPVSLSPASSFACTGQYTVTEADLNAGRFVNTATASALSPLGVLVSDEDSATALGPLLLFPADPDLGTVEAGDPFTAEFFAVGGIPPYTFDVGPLPAGFSSSVSGETLTISGVTLRAGRFEMPVTVQDSSEPPEQVIRTYFLQVEAELELAPESLPDAVQGTDYFQALTVINGIPPFRFLAADDLPPGLSLVDNVLLGIPGEAGEFEFSIIALDAQDNVGQADYTLTVLPPEFEASNLDLPDAVVDVSYSHQLFTSSPANPVVWSDAEGLPAGLELQYTGFIAGTPREVGSFEIRARATNALGQTTDAVAGLVVLERGVINATPGLPPGITGQEYNSPLTIFGSDPPFECEASSGELPTGLILADCEVAISGIPSEPGTFGFELEVTDSADPPSSDRGPFSIRIADPDDLRLGEEPDLTGARALPVPVPDFGQGRPGPDFDDESLQQMAIDAFGNRYLVGFSFNGEHYDILILKFDPDGSLLWSQRFDSGDNDYGYGIAINPRDQGIYVTGYLLNGNRFEGVVLSFDAAGVLRWERRLTGGVLLDALYGIAADRNAVYVTGERFNGNNFDALYAAFSHEGQALWSRTRTTAPTQTGYVVNADDCELPPCPLLVGGSEGDELAAGWLLAVDRETGGPTSEQLFGQAGILALTGTSDGWVIGGDTPAGQWRVTRLDRDLQPIWGVTLPDGRRVRGLVADEADFIYAAGRTADGQDALIKLLGPGGQDLQSRAIDTGAQDRFNGLGIGPEGRLTAAGERREPEGNRAILVNLNTGKAF